MNKGLQLGKSCLRRW